MTETIDNVLQALISAGGEKIDWDETALIGQQGRNCPIGSWSIKEETDCSFFEHLSSTITQRLCRLDLNVSDDSHLQAIFDPETRRIEALEIYETDSGHVMLTLTFWPGLEVARQMSTAVYGQWCKAIDDGWFEGVV